MEKVLLGQISFESAPAAIQSWARLPIYEGACAILKLEKREDRKKALQSIPELIRPHVEKEVWRIWRLRNEI